MEVEREIDHAPRLSLAVRARRGLLVLGAALGCAAAGATVVVGAQRGATQAYLAESFGSGCSPWGCYDSWWEWPPDKSPFDSPPTAVVAPSRRIA
jgi:hypothetical protein